MKLHRFYEILICLLILTAIMNLVSISQAGPPVEYIPRFNVTIKSLNDSYDNGIIPLTVDLNISYGSKPRSHEILGQNVRCNYRLDEGQWTNIPFIEITSSKDFYSWDYEQTIHEVHYNFSTNLYGLSDGFHVIEVTPNYPDYQFGLSGTSFVYFTSNASSGITVVSVLLLPEIHSSFQNPPKENVKANEEIKISVNVTDPYFGVKNVTLFYSIDNATTWENRTMNYNTQTSLYEATIPGQPIETEVNFKIVAYNNDGKSATNDGTEPYYTFEVIPEFPSWIILPLIMIVTLFAVVFRKKLSLFRKVLKKG